MFQVTIETVAEAIKRGMEKATRIPKNQGEEFEKEKFRVACEKLKEVLNQILQSDFAVKKEKEENGKASEQYPSQLLAGNGEPEKCGDSDGRVVEGRNEGVSVQEQIQAPREERSGLHSSPTKRPAGRPKKSPT